MTTRRGQHTEPTPPDQTTSSATTVPGSRSAARRERRVATRRRRGALLVTAAAAASALTIASLVQLSDGASAAGYIDGDVIASDSFSRTEAAGFGSADRGGAWDAGSGLAVDGGSGTVSFARAGTSRSTELSGAHVGDSRTAVTVVVPEHTRTGGGVYFTLQARSTGSSSYGATLRLAPDGDASLRIVRFDGARKTVIARSVRIASGVEPGTPVRIELQVTGSDEVATQARAYPLGTAAPEWQRAGTDPSDTPLRSGGVGVWTYLSTASAEVPVTIDDFSAVELVATDTPVPSTPVTPPPPPTAEPTPTTPAPSPTTPTPTPTPTATESSTPPLPTQSPAPVPDAPNGSTGAGSAPVGSTAYAVPDDAVFVSSAASSEGDGSRATPFRTVTRAIERAADGDTLVLRGGTYHEDVKLRPGKRLTIQSYPGEAVWFDGSEKISEWKPSGSTWVADGWDYDFDTSPTFVKGAPDNTHESTKFLDPKYPLAAHPDQVWIDGKALTEVGSRGKVVPGTFFVDRAADQLILGSNPSGRDVRASTLQLGIDVMSDGSVVRGIGVQRYATSVWQKAPLLAQAADVRIENVVARDNAASGIAGARGTGIVFSAVTLSGNGRSGGGATYTDHFTLEDSLVYGNNTQHFKAAPSSGGFKIGRSRHVTFTENVFDSNLTGGLWFDESVYDGTVTGNHITGNQTGLTLELSAKFTVADNVIEGNTGVGISVQSAGSIQIWNNTIVGNGGAPLNITQDQRRQTDLSDAGHDPRQSLPDMTVPWLTQDITVANNLFGSDLDSGMLHVLDHEKKLTGKQMRIKTDGNIYQHTNAGGYTVVRWADGGGGPLYFRSLDAFTAATGQEGRSVFVTAPTAVDEDFSLTAEVAALSGGVAVRPPSALAGLLGALGVPAVGATPTP